MLVVFTKLLKHLLQAESVYEVTPKATQREALNFFKIKFLKHQPGDKK